MAVLEYCAKHNMIAYLEKIKENAQFHEIVDILSRSLIFYALSSLPKKFSLFIIKQGLKFSGKITHLFHSMLTQAAVAEGEDSGTPTESQPTHSPTQRGTGDQPPLTESSSDHDSSQDPRVELEGTGRSGGDQARIKKLEKRCKLSISHHRAWLRSVSLLSKKKILSKKNSVSKQGRKNAKLGPTKDGSDKLDAELDEEMEYIDTEEAVNEGRQSIVDTARPDISTARPDDDTSRPNIARDEEIARQLEVELQAEEDERMIRDMNKKAEEESSDKGVDSTKKRKEGSRMKKMSKRQKTYVDLEEEEKLKTFLKIDPDEEGVIDYEVLDKRFPIINWESKFYHYDKHGAEGIYYRIFRSDGSSRWIKTFSEMVTRFDRLDLVELYNLVMQRFESTTPKGVDLILWGDLRTMFKANAEDELWQNQEKWSLKSWIFYENCGVHILILEDGTKIHMLAERRMLSLRMIADSASDDAYDLLRFIQKHIDESREHDRGENDL
nr:hypothetical protein [Tanacetum cinerariifolium]